jgi:hypothetical protein
MARKPFNWSQLTRGSLYSMLYKAGKDIVGKKLAVEDIQSILSKHIKKHIPIKVVSDRDPVTAPGYIYVGGTYYSILDRKNRSRFLEVIFSYHLLDEHLKITQYKWSRICHLFADTVLHEVIHTRQYRARNFKDIPGYESTAYYAKDRRQQEYYGDRDEMGAHSFNIACELYDRFGDNFSLAKQYLDSNDYKRHKRTTWFRYMKTFEHDHTHKIIRRMKRKILNQMPYAQIGKPFLTNCHLTY